MPTGLTTSRSAARLAEPARLTDARLGRIIDQSVNEIYVFCAEGLRFLEVNKGARANLGYGTEELARLTPLDIKPDFTASSFERLLLPLRQGDCEQLTFQTVHRRKNGTTYDVEVRLQLMYEELPAVFLAEIEDITARKLAEERQRLVMAELNHRIKNTLATVLSIANQTMRHSPSAAEFVTSFGNRLQAMTRAHDQVTRGGWREVPLHAVIDAALDAFGQDCGADYVIQAASEIMLSPDEALSLSLVMHELTTNSLKYGALSVDAGRVKIAYDVDKAKRLVFFWVESGGPEVANPTRTGFGSKLIASIGRALGGEARIAYPASGVHCEIAFPLAASRPHVHSPASRAPN